MILDAAGGLLLFLILLALCVIIIPFKNIDILYRKIKMDLYSKTLENQKITADTISLPLSKEELKLIIYGLSFVPTNDQVVNIYQKLTKKLEILEDKNETRS